MKNNVLIWGPAHPPTPELFAELYAQKGIGTFRFSEALIEWSQSELEGLQKIWVQAPRLGIHSAPNGSHSTARLA